MNPCVFYWTFRQGIFILNNTMNKHNDLSELEKAKAYVIVEMLSYKQGAMRTRTLLKKTTGNITLTSIAAGGTIAENALPFDLFIQIVDGAAEVIIKEKTYTLQLGEGLVIPAHAAYRFQAAEQFKMLTTIIKSGYEE